MFFRGKKIQEYDSDNQNKFKPRQEPLFLNGKTLAFRPEMRIESREERRDAMGFSPWRTSFKPTEKSFKKKEPRFFKAPKKSGNWRAIAVVFGFTALASLAFYAKTEIGPFLKRINTPSVITNENDAAKSDSKPKFDPSGAIQKIEEQTKSIQGSYGIYFQSLVDENANFGIDADGAYAAASIMKMPVMITLYRETEAGRINLETKYKLVNTDKVGGAGVLQGGAAGTLYSYRELAQFMGKYSDNTAYMVLRKILSDRKVQETINMIGMNKTSLKDHNISPSDLAKMFTRLYKGEILGQKYADEILSNITDTIYENWMPAGIPEGTKVAHKIGKDLGTFNDAGIIFVSKPYVLVIMSKDANEKEADVALPVISKIVYEFAQQ